MLVEIDERRGIQTSVKSIEGGIDNLSHVRTYPALLETELITPAAEVQADALSQHTLITIMYR